ncbi:MAG: hypothetical protein ACRDND_29880, partial [Streptosporangiaceae bacterium]
MLRTRIATAAFGAGITATVLAGAMMTAGPAAASPAAHTVTARAATAAAGTPVSSAAARLNRPALRRFVPWGRATAAGASAMTPQARMAAAANALGFSGAELVGVSWADSIGRRNTSRRRSGDGSGSAAARRSGMAVGD